MQQDIKAQNPTYIRVVNPKESLSDACGEHIRGVGYCNCRAYHGKVFRIFGDQVGGGFDPSSGSWVSYKHCHTVPEGERVCVSHRQMNE